MPYNIIQPPFTLKFRDMSKQELKSYFRWFLDAISMRTRELAEVVKQTPGFGAWEPDQTPESLNALGEWLATQVVARHRTAEEIHEIASRSSVPIEIPAEELTNRTFSLAIDVGMYMSQVLLTNHPTLRWEQPFGSKKFVDYGQPVLAGFGQVLFNPVRMMVTYSYGVVSGKATSQGLRDMYEIWSKMALANP